jgi:hypothetical protein
MGNSVVSYPYAVGERNVYLFTTTLLIGDAEKGQQYVPISAPIEQEKSPLSSDYGDPYEWLWWSGEGNRERGPLATKAGVLKVEGFHEMIPRVMG